ncbi:dioxygenase [Aspergillus costaricaensis CBS 115574]|uniref:Dioxygenase n=1 Tax=Aspergillus costaricaensis CBS 115574 TaxID=1448317 RepID=A0ACD1I8C5_9EURO|nr:dioxygenase [Aspergillus costaricaensis CBS 115574]RAK86528.1 dioxygenase [Aspergillus costaricaensis CBS 115574]
MHFFSFLVAATLASLAIAHPGPHKKVTRAEITRRQELSSRCAHHAGEYNAKRWKRSLEKRQNITTIEATTEAPYYKTIQNETCVLTPDVTSGPYWWTESQTLRQDIREDQSGVPLSLDIGVMDMATCGPLEGVLVDVWHCNATGKYSSFTGLRNDIPKSETLQDLNMTWFEPGQSDIHTDNQTWLRGMWPTDSNGMVEMKTIFPGQLYNKSFGGLRFYFGRSIHIHIQVHTDWVLRDNGTLASGNTVSTGQVFFDEELEQEIMALEPYSSVTGIQRLVNGLDDTFHNENTDGYNAIVSVVPMDGVDVRNGMIGYITVGVDTEAVDPEFPVR